MKSIIITIAVIFALVIVIAFLGFTMTDKGKKTIEDWNIPSGQGIVDGIWGTEIIVEFEDGTTKYLNEPLPLLEIAFEDKRVDNFKYILSTRGTSDTYNQIEIDISNFNVLTAIQNREEEWGTKKTFTNIVSMDGSWYNIYGIQVDANELETLDSGFTYNLSFVPSGTIAYRDSSSSSWINVPLPNWYYLNFQVQETTDDEGVDKWIEIDISSDTGIESDDGSGTRPLEVNT